MNKDSGTKRRRVHEAERYVIARKSLHMTNIEIAAEHGIGNRTVERHLKKPEIVAYIEELKQGIREDQKQKSLEMTEGPQR